jgi:pimeloyl-ACP methyl ester carboxylesterase
VQPESRHIVASGLRWHVRVAGDGPPVLLLHGFPEDSRSWDLTWPALVAAGLRVYMPDLKGYGGTDKPRPGGPGGDYRVSALSDEVAGLIDHIASLHGQSALPVVGHDWGGILLSALLARHAGRVERAALLNAPFVRFVPWRPVHVYGFNLPWLPEAAFRVAPRATIDGILRWWSARAGVFTPAEVDGYVEALGRDGSFACAMAYYRGLVRDVPFIVRSLRDVRRGPIEAPEVRVIWGKHDPILPLRVGEMAAEDVGGTLVPVDAGHFVHREAPSVVNRELLALLR